MSDKEKMIKILQFLQMNIAEFAKNLEINADELYNLNSGRKVNFSQELRAKIIKKYEQIDPVWLLTGEEPMLRTEIQHNEQQNVSIGGDNIVNGSSKTTSEGLLAVMELVMSQQKTIQDLTEQNKMLTRMIAER